MLPRIVRLAVCIAVPALAIAWSQAVDKTSSAVNATAQGPKTAVLEGKVVSQATGAPLKKTTLRLSPGAMGGTGRPLSTETDDEGRFSFPKVEPGIYALTGERAGYALQYFNAHSGSGYGAPIPLKEGDVIRNIVFRLVPNALLSGKVVDEDGDPVSRAAVAVLRSAYRTSGRQLQSFTTATTGANGEFSVSVPPGRYYLATTPASNLIASLTSQSAKPLPDGPEFAYGPTFYPNSPDEQGGSPILASAAADLRGLDIHLAKSKTYRVRGQVADTAARFNTLQLQPKTFSALSNFVPKLATLQADRTFEFVNILPGTYNLMAMGESGPLIYRGSIIVADRHITGLPVILAPMGELKGTVTVESEGAQPAAAPLIGFDRSRILIGFDSFENGSNPSAPVADDGTFTIRMILPDRYHPWIGHPPKNSWVKAIRYEGRDVKDEGIDITNGITGPVEFVLSPTAGDISGVIVDEDGKPVAGATALLLPKSGGYLNHYAANSDNEGKFQFHPVRPGDYVLLAWEDIAYLAWYDKEFLKPFLSRGVDLSVAPNDRNSLRVKVIPMKESR